MNGVVKPFPPSSALSRARARETAQLVQVRALAERGASEARAMVRQRRQRLINNRRRLIACAIACLAIGFSAGAWVSFVSSQPTLAIPALNEQVVYQVEFPKSAPLVQAPLVEPLATAVTTTPTTIQVPSTTASTPAPNSMPPGQPPSQTKQQAVLPKLTVAIKSPAGSSQGEKDASVPSVSTNVYEATVKQDVPREVVTKTAELRVIGIPVDGVLQLDVNGTVRQFKPGQTLPNGEVLTEANASSNKFKTNRVPSKSDQN